MKSTKLVAIVLIAVGISAFAYYGITYKTREKVIDLGSIQVTAEKTKTLPWQPIVGAVGLIAGTALLIVGLKKG